MADEMVLEHHEGGMSGYVVYKLEIQGLHGKGQSSLPRSISCSRNSHIPTQRKFLMKTGTGFGRSRQPSEEVWAGGRQSALHQLHHHRQLCFWRNLLFKTSREMMFHSSLYVYDYSCCTKWNVEGNFGGGP